MKILVDFDQIVTSEKTPNGDWEDYYRGMTLLEHEATFMKKFVNDMVKNGNLVMAVSKIPITYRHVAFNLALNKSIRFFDILMKSPVDNRSDAEAKLGLALEYFTDRLKLDLYVTKDQRAIDLFTSAGIDCLCYIPGRTS